ncbi:UNVERIFIED_CONTAM: hypothetical protein K2H54_011156 [Gekko kuhli]
MAEASENGKSTKASIQKAEADLPPPVSQDSVPDPPPVPGSQDSNPLPLPPPKESFSKFYQQRQVNELKRLYRHMHPELRKNLEEAVTEDLAEMLSTDDPTAQASVNSDPVLPGEVQSMRWIFENWTLDSIGEHQGARKLAEEEAIPSGDVKIRSMKFESQSFNGDRLTASGSASENEKTKGDVHTARWLFETQPLDSLNKMYLDETDMQEAVLKEPVQRGDVKGAAQLFETHSLDALGRCSSVDEQSILQLKSEIQELKGDVEKTIKLFQTEPLCAIRDKTGNIHEIKSVCREEIHSNAVRTARWLFETQPLDTINKDMSKVQVIRGISLEEVAKGNVSGAKWLFETQPLDAIRETTVEEADFKASPDLVQGADVTKQCLLFETQPLDALKGEVTDSTPAKEEVIRGDVKSTLWLFETQPMETLKDNFEVGQLKKVELSDEEKGAVKQRKHVFETCPLGSISKATSEDFSTTNIQEVEKGDVKAFKSLFETLPLDSIRQVSTEEVVKEAEEVLHGNVKANQFLFETTPLYAIKDSFGNFHEVTSVSREEEVVAGDVKNYKWKFETKPLDQFDDSTQKVDVIKGITKQEVVAGDVKTAKWLFETQPIDVIHSQINLTEQDASEKGEDSRGGDVKTCRWLFETHRMDALYEKAEKKQDREEPVPQGDVKSYTWMFETQPLDSLRGQEEQYLQVSKTFSRDELQGVDVKTARHLFETEPLIDNASDDVNSKKIIRYSSRIEMQSGEVSRVKEFFEAKPLDSARKSDTDMKEIRFPEDENIEPGAVHKFTWLFENCPMDTLKSSMEDFQEVPPEKDIQSGDVGGKRFIFETYSLGQIHDKENEIQFKKIQEQTLNKAAVKSCTMLFETQPLYAIQDRDGGYHEVTSVKKEEIMKGDVKGARWQFETKPLDQIKKDEEVFVIRAVTQEDFKKGDVQAARWRFETEPLDSIAEDKRPVLRTIDDVQRGDVQSNKQLFESEKFSQKRYVRMVSVSDVQQGDVRTSTWLFENQPIDSLKGQPESASTLNTVQREDIHKGDVKRCTWLFETQPMDSLKDTEASSAAGPPEVVPQADVKSTTWLFESTPLDKLSTSERHMEMEMKERTITDTLGVLFSHQVIQHGGILIEANDTESVKMAKYQCSSQGAPEVQKEEVVGGHLERILLQLLHRTNVEAEGSLVKEEENGDIKISPVQLLDPSTAEKSKEDLRDDVAKALQGLLSQDASAKKGIVMQETGTGSVKITIYSLLHCVAQQEEPVKGDVKSTIGNLLASSQEQKATATIRREDNERGNVHLYTTCIEKGDLDYLKNLQRESEIESLVSTQAKEEPSRDVQEVTAPAQLQDEKVVRTTADVTIGGSSGPKQVFLCDSKEGTLEREAGLASDLDCTLHCLRQPPSAMVEEVVSGNVKLAENGSNRAVGEGKAPGDRKEGADSTKVAAQKDEIDGATQMAAQPKSQELGGDLQAAMHSLRLATAEAQSLQHQVHGKLQKTTENIHLIAKQPQAATPQQVAAVQATVYNEGHAASKQQHTSNVTIVRVQEMSKSHASMSQKSTASHAKVSAPEEVQGGKLPPVDFQDGPVMPSAQISIKDGLYTAQPVKTYVNPFVESDYKEHSVPEEREQDAIIRGDVKMAIRALQSAAAEQRQVEKEDVVRGSLRAALESLEKSNVNVSKGDFKAAMIYRNAGQPSSIRKNKNEAQVLREQAAVAASGSQAANDFPPPPPPPASVTRIVCPSTNLRDADALGCPMAVQPSVPKTLPPPPTKPSDQRPLEKPQLLPKPEVIPPPRRKPLPPPKPEFLLQETLPHPAGSHQSRSGKAVSPPFPSRSPSRGDQNIPVTSLTNQAQASGGANILDQSAPRQDSTDCPLPPSPMATAVEKRSFVEKATKDIIKTPLQVAEEKYKSRKEEQKELEGADLKPSSETIKIGSADCERGDSHPTKEIQDFLWSCQPENGCPLPAGQEGALSLEGQIGPVHMEGQKKPYLSAKCHANVLRKGTITTHASSSRIESTSTCEARGSRDNQKTSPRAEEIIPEAAVSAPPSLPSKQILKGHQCLNSRESGDLSVDTVQHAETETPVVIMREKACRETEEERRKRLSVHKEEIMKGNVKEAMEIFENLRKQEELQEILTRVKEFEDETSKVDVKALKSFFENVPEWVVHHQVHQIKPPKMDKAEQIKEVKEDADSISSVELAFEDLERASAEIIHLKEQTLSRLLDIEEAIRKALYSISNLKSESDIAGLSGLLQESLGNSQSLAASNNIRKISIVSSKARQERGIQNSSWGVEKVAEKTEMPKIELEVPLIIQPRANSPSSPSYISIQSAARKPAESPKMAHSSASDLTDGATERELFTQGLFSSLPRKSVRSDGCNLAPCEGEQERIQMSKGVGLVKQQHLSSSEHLQPQINNNGDKEWDSSQSLIKGGVPDCPSKAPLSALSPSNPRRQKSILELQTSHDGSKLYGATRTVMEEYEEVDEFGNKIITSSTTVTKQSETQTSSTCDMVSCPTRYEVTASPILRKYLNSPDGFPAVVKEQCTSCSEPVYPAEHLAGQKIPLPQSCFYCQYCGKKLSLLNYAVLHGSFYCQVHYKLLAKGGSREEKTSIPPKCQQWEMAVLPGPGLKPKTQNNSTGKILMREKMPPRLCSLRPEDGLRSAKQTRPLASQNKLRIRWPPSKEAGAPEDAVRKVSKFGTSKELPRDSALFQHSRPSGFTHKTPRHKSIAETSRIEKMQRLFPKVAFPKRKDRVSCWFKPEGESEDLEVLEKRVPSMDRKIPGSQARKSQAGISEKAKACQLVEMLQWKGGISTTSPLISISAEPSAVGLSPVHLKALQAAKATQSARRASVLSQRSSPEKASFKGYNFSGRSTSKEASKEGNAKETLQNTEDLLKARIRLPVLTKMDNGQNRKVPKASKMDTSIALVLEESKQFGHVSPKLKPEVEDHKPFQATSEASVYPTEHKDEESNETKDYINWISTSYPHSLEINGAPNQVNEAFQTGRSKSPGNIVESTRSASLQGPEKLPYPKTLSEEMEQENKINPEGKPEHFGTLYYPPDQASQDAKLEDVAGGGDGCSVFRSRDDDSENRDFLPSRDPQNATLLCQSQVNKDFQAGGNKSPENVVESMCSASLQGPETLPRPETFNKEVEKENKMNPEGKPECFGTLYYAPDQDSQDAELEAIPSAIEEIAEGEDGCSIFHSQDDEYENRNILPSSDPQNTIPLSHLTPSANESLEPVTVPNKNEVLLGQASSENAFHLPSKSYTVEGTVLQDSEVKKTETSSSGEATSGTENQPTGNENVKSQNQDGSTLQANEGKDIPGGSAKKPPLKKEMNPFARVFATKNRGGSPKKESAGTKNMSKKPSALVTLFGYSSDKDKNKKEQSRKTITKSLMVEGSDEKLLRAESLSSPSNTEKNSQVVIQSRNSEANLLDLGRNYQSCSGEEQRKISSPVVNTKVCSAKALPVVLDTDSSSSAAVLSETMNLEIPKPSALNKETIPQYDAESSPFASFQNPFVTTGNMLQSCASPSVETHSITNVASSRDLHDEELSNLADLDSPDLKLKARNVSFSCASRENDARLIERDHKIPDMLLFSMKNNGSVNIQERAPQFTPDLDLGSSQMKDKPDHALSSSDENLLQRSNSHRSSECGPPATTESVNNKNILRTGDAGIFQHETTYPSCGHPCSAYQSFSKIPSRIQLEKESLQQKDTMKGRWQQRKAMNHQEALS